MQSASWEMCEYSPCVYCVVNSCPASDETVMVSAGGDLYLADTRAAGRHRWPSLRCHFTRDIWSECRGGECQGRRWWRTDHGSQFAVLELCVYSIFFFQQEWEISIGGAMMIVQSTTCMYFYWSQWSRGHGTVCPSITGPHWRHVRLAWSSYITQNHNLNIFWRFPVNPITWWETNRKNKTLCQTAALFTVRQEHCPLYQCAAL